MASDADHAFAARLAERAGALLLDIRRGLERDGGDVQQVRGDGDRRSHELLVHALAAAYPRDSILSEEGADDRARLANRRVWIVDPLDGTREFGEVGRWDWAVHVALAIDERALAGAVVLPARGITLSTVSPPVLPARRRDGLRIAVSRTRPPEIASRVAEQVGAELVPMGSAGAKVAAVLLGEVDAYVHGGGQSEWDSAAPVAVATAAGAHASRLDGRPLVYNQERPWLPDLLVCRAELAPQILDAIAVASGAR